MINPNEHIRIAIINALSPLSVWSNIVPRTVTTPNQYALITSMGKQEFAVAKNCYEWEVSLNLDVFQRGSLGQDYSALLDRAIALVIPAMKNLKSPIVRIKDVTLEFERDESFATTTEQINRKILNYTIWCDYQES